MSTQKYPRNTSPSNTRVESDRNRWTREIAWLVILVIVLIIGFFVNKWFSDDSDTPSTSTQKQTEQTAQTAQTAKPDKPQTETKPRGYESVTGHITHIADGDTVEIELQGGKEARIRFLGIDAPELHQEGGPDSRKHLVELLKPCKQDVTVYYKEARTEDRYGRLIGKVVCDGTDVNYEMVKAGQAWYYSQYEKDVMPKDRTLYKEAQEQAKEAKLGLWKQENPTEPWDWRKANREKEGQE